MGAFASRQNARVEEVDNNSNNAYKYPPKSGLLKIHKNAILLFEKYISECIQKYYKHNFI